MHSHGNTISLTSTKSDSNTVVEVLESNFAALVSGLKELDATRRRVINRPDAAHLIFTACDTYCGLSKKTLRSVIQAVDKIIEERLIFSGASVEASRGFAKSVKGAKRSTNITEFIIRARDNVFLQRVLDHWKIYILGQRMKKVVDKRQADMIARLESAQKLAEGAKSEVVEVERKDSHLRDEVTRARSENASLVEKVRKLEVRISQQEQEVSQCMLENENLKVSNKRLMAFSRSSTRSRSPVNKQGELDVASHNETLKTVQSDVRALNEQLQESNEAADHLSSELARLKSQQVKDRKEQLSEMRVVQAENDQLREQLDEFRVVQVENDRLQEELADVRAQLRDMRDQPNPNEKALEGQLVELRAQLNDSRSLSVENVRLKEQLADLRSQQSASDELRDQLKNVQFENDRFQTQLAELRLRETRVCKTCLELPALEKSVEQLSCELRQKTAQLTMAEEDVKQLSVDLKQADEEIEQVSNAKEQLEARLGKLAEMEGFVTILKADLARAEDDIDEILREKQNLQAQLDAAVKELRELGGSSNTDQAVVELERKLIELEAAHGAGRDLENTLRVELAQKARLVTGLESKVEALESSLIEKEKELERVNGTRTIELEALQAKVASLESALSQRGKLLAELEAKIETLDTDGFDKAELEAKIAELVSDLRLADEEVDRLEAAIAERDSEVDRLEAAISDRDSEMDRLAARVSELEQPGEDVAGEVTPAVLVSDFSQTEIDTLKSDRNELTVQIAALQSQIDLLDNDLTAAENEIDGLNATIVLLTKEKEAAEAQVALNGSSELELRARIVALENEIGRMLRGSSDKRVDRLEVQRAELEAELVEAGKAHKNLQEQVTGLTKKLLLAEAEVGQTARLQAQLAAGNRRIEELEKQLADSAAQDATESAALQSQLAEQISQKAQVESDLKTAQSDFAIIKADLTAAENEIDALQAEVKVKDLELKRLQATEADLTARSRNAEQRLDETLPVKAELEVLKAERARLELHLTSKVNAEAKVSELSAELAGVILGKAKIEAELLACKAKLQLRSSSQFSVVKDFVTLAPNDADASVLASLKSALVSAEQRHATLVLELAEKEKTITSQCSELSKKTDSGELLATIQKLAEEKNSLTARLSRLEDLLGDRQKGKVDQLEQVIKDFVSQAKPSLALEPLSGQVSVDTGGTVASYVGQNKDSDMSGCLITTTPLPVFEEGVYFELRVGACSAGNPDGLTIGVTTAFPPDSLVPNTLDDIPSSWAVGFNGQTWSSSKAEWKAVPWSGKDLVQGQRVGVLVAAPPVSQLFIFVDDTLACRGPSRLPSCFDYEFFGLIDLLGNCDSATLLWGAHPPVSAKDLVAVDPRKTAVSKLQQRIAEEVSPHGGGRRFTLPKLPLRPTAEPVGPVRPPSSSSDE